MGKKAKKRSSKSTPVDTPSIALQWRFILQIALIIAATLLVFWPALHGDWFWDDEKLVVNNYALRNLHGLGQFWIAMPEGDYWPLTWTLLWAQWQFWPGQPFGFHLCNLVLHLISAFLIWRLLGRLGLRWGWMGGLLFAIHPLGVESVAWISEIKNTLSLPFFLLSLDAWLDAEEDKKNFGYLRSLCFYLIAMLCKTSVIMLPVVLLLYGWWKRGGIGWLYFQKTLPYFAIALILGPVMVFYRHTNGPVGQGMFPGDFISRLAGAGVDIFFYMEKFIFPINLMVIYPRWKIDPPSFFQILAAPLLVILLVSLWTQRKGWGRHALLGLGFFLLTVFPVLGFVKMGYMEISWVADHFIYLPMIGLVGLTVAGAEAAWRRLSRLLRPVLVGCMVTIATLLMLETHAYAALFANHEKLWTSLLQQNPMAWMAHNNLGILYAKTPRRLTEAIAQYEQALKINPANLAAHNNLGNALMKMPGQMPRAIEEFQTALRIDPHDADTRNNLGSAWLRTPGRQTDAIAEFQKAIQLNPNQPAAHNNLGNALAGTDRLPDAIEEFNTALRLNPNDPEAHYNLGIAFANTSRLSQAIAEFETVVRLNPHDAEAHYNLAIVLVNTPAHTGEAISHLKEALSIRPDFEPARQLLLQLQAP